MEISVWFAYNGKSKSEKLEKMSCEKTERGDTVVTTYDCVHTESGTGWKITHTEYAAFGATELRAEIYAHKDTEIFDGIEWRVLLDGQNGKLIGNYGDKDLEFEEYEKSITESPIIHRALDGRPTHVYFPYYRIETDKTKTVAALSWQGTWQAEFESVGNGTQMRAGQYGVHTFFKAGEKFGLPALLLLPYETDSVNVWRRFYFKHVMPKVKGERLRPKLGVFNGQCEGLTAQNVEQMRRVYDINGVNYDFWWFDAGWGTDGTGAHNRLGQWYHGVNFEMNGEAFPDGLHAFGKSLKENGKELMLWFEPEIIRTPPEHWEEFFGAHPDFDRNWILGVYAYDWCGTTLTAQMLDLGNESCRRWLIKRVYNVMDTAGVDIYRQDCNIPPFEVWKNADEADRKGIAENRYCTGLLEYYSAIRSACGDILMDTCASGGGRCDLDTMRFMVPLHYSDHQDVSPADFNGHIYMQQIIWRWFPYVKNWLSPAAMASDYGARSVMNACLVACVPMADARKTDFARMKKCIDEWRGIADLFLCDYYEWEKPTRDDVHVKAFEFFDSERQKGMAMVFVPENCEKRSYRAFFRGLNADITYCAACKDCDMSVTATGRELSESGAEFTVAAGQSYIICINKSVGE